MTPNELRLSNLFQELVPAYGKATTVAGEIVRAINRIAYRNFNDGDHLGIGYGRETVNPAGRYLAGKCGGKVGDLVWDAWAIYDDDAYDKALDRLEAAVLEYLDAHPELKQQENAEDFWDYRDRYEDVDTYDDEEEEW